MADSSITSSISVCLKGVMPVLRKDQEAVVYELSAEWCHSCKQLDKYLISADGKKKSAAFAFRRIDWDKDQSVYKCFSDNHYLDLGTMRIPSFLIFDRGIRYSGYVAYDSQKPLAEQIWNQLKASRKQSSNGKRE